MIILNAEDDLRRPVIPTLHIEETRSAVLTTRSEVDYLDLIILIIREQNIFWLHITVNYAFVLHEFETLAHLFRYDLKLLRIKSLLCSFIQLLVFVQIDTQAIEDNYYMLPEAEMVDHVHQAVMPFIVVIQWLH